MFEFVSIFIVGFLAVLTPGPDVLLISRSALYYGAKRALLVQAGISSGHIIYLAVVYFGLAMFFEIASVRFLLNLGGGIYLLYLSILLFRAKDAEVAIGHKIKKVGFFDGLIVNLSNPKAILFFMVVLTPFLEGEKLLLQIIVLFVGMLLAFLLVIYAIVYFKSRFESSGKKMVKYLDIGVSALFFVFSLIMFFNCFEILSEVV